MSINSVGAGAPQAPSAYPSGKGADKAEDKELTTVTTHCNKKHQHDQSCPHTTSTKPAPKSGEPGHLLDKNA